MRGAGIYRRDTIYSMVGVSSASMDRGTFATYSHGRKAAVESGQAVKIARVTFAGHSGENTHLAFLYASDG